MNRLRPRFKQRPLLLVPKSHGEYQGLLSHIWLPTGWTLCSRRRFDQRASQAEAIRVGVRPCVQCVLIATALNAQANDLVDFFAEEDVVPSIEEIEYEVAVLNLPTPNRRAWNMKWEGR